MQFKNHGCWQAWKKTLVCVYYIKNDQIKHSLLCVFMRSKKWDVRVCFAKDEERTAVWDRCDFLLLNHLWDLWAGPCGNVRLLFVLLCYTETLMRTSLKILNITLHMRSRRLLPALSFSSSSPALRKESKADKSC